MIHSIGVWFNLAWAENRNAQTLKWEASMERSDREMQFRWDPMSGFLSCGSSRSFALPATVRDSRIFEYAWQAHKRSSFYFWVPASSVGPASWLALVETSSPLCDGFDAVRIVQRNISRFYMTIPISTLTSQADAQSAWTFPCFCLLLRLPSATFGLPWFLNRWTCRWLSCDVPE